MTLIKNNIGTAQFNFTDFETSYQLDIQLGFLIQTLKLLRSWPKNIGFKVILNK